jgi:hypothetical protein
LPLGAYRPDCLCDSIKSASLSLEVLPEWAEAMANGAPTNLVVRRELFRFAEGYPVDKLFRRD